MFIAHRSSAKQAPSEQHVRNALASRCEIHMPLPTELVVYNTAATINMARLRRWSCVQARNVYSLSFRPLEMSAIGATYARLSPKD